MDQFLARMIATMRPFFSEITYCMAVGLQVFSRAALNARRHDYANAVLSYGSSQW
jgi:hypothetical protein